MMDKRPDAAALHNSNASSSNGRTSSGDNERRSISSSNSINNGIGAAMNSSNGNHHFGLNGTASVAAHPADPSSSSSTLSSSAALPPVVSGSGLKRKQSSEASAAHPTSSGKPLGDQRPTSPPIYYRQEEQQQPTPSLGMTGPAAKRLHRNRSRSPPLRDAGFVTTTSTSDSGSGSGGTGGIGYDRVAVTSPQRQPQDQLLHRDSQRQHETATTNSGGGGGAGLEPEMISKITGAPDASASSSNQHGMAAAAAYESSSSSSSSLPPPPPASKFATDENRAPISDPKNSRDSSRGRTASPRPLLHPRPDTTPVLTPPPSAASACISHASVVVAPIDRQASNSSGGNDTRRALTSATALALPIAFPVTAPAPEDENAEGEDDPSTPSATTPAPTSLVLPEKTEEAAPSFDPGSAIKSGLDDDASLSGRSAATRHRKLAAMRAPSVAAGERLSRSALGSPVPSATLMLPSDASFAASAPSTRATTSVVHATPRSRRRKKDRTVARSITPRPVLPRLDSADRRRSGRIAKASTSTAATSADSASLLNLAKYDFSLYLEGLVLGNREPERKTRGGGRGPRAAAGRNVTLSKKGPKAKTREKDKEAEKDKEGDGPTDDAKAELYLQLCILSYQLQAELDLVPFKTVEQLRAEFLNPPAATDEEDRPLDGTDRRGATPPGGLDGWPPTPPQQFTPWDTAATSTAKSSAKTSQHPSPTKALQEVPVEANAVPAPAGSPPSSPEMPLMASLAAYRRQPAAVDAHTPNYPWNAPRPLAAATVPEPSPWNDAATFGSADASPEVRPIRPNIMSISALMSGPTPRLRSPTPPPTPSIPSALIWTQEDELASEILQGLGLDYREFGASADTEMASLPSDLAARSGTQTPAEADPGSVPTSISAFDPHRMDVLSKLDLASLFAEEKDAYAKEKASSSELYTAMRYLAIYDDVVDRWRASELSRLRTQIDMRKQEVGRLISAERDAAWMDFHEQQESLLLRDGAAKLTHARWQAESKLHRIARCKPQSRVLAKVQEGLYVPRDSGAASLEAGRQLYRQYGDFLQGSEYAALRGPLVQADVDKIRRGVAAARYDPSQDTIEVDGDSDDDDGVLEAEDEGEVEDNEDEDEDESCDETDTSAISIETGLSSLPSFTSVASQDGSDGDSATTLYDDTHASDMGMDIDPADSSDEDVALMTLQQQQQQQLQQQAEDDPYDVTPKRKRRPPPPGVRWWKAGKPMDS